MPADGQRWTTLEELSRDHGNWIREDAGFLGIGTQPEFGIGQRALLVPHGGSNVLWDCISLLDDETAAEVERHGGLDAIAISHPHFYGTMVEWAHRFDCPVYLHAADREWIMRPDPAIELWDGATKDLGEGLTLVRCGGHFAGGTVLHAGDALLCSDIVQIALDRDWVSFMYSYPNLIPLSEEAIYGIVAALEPFSFQRLVGMIWDQAVARDAQEVVSRSAERYVRALRGEALD